MKLQIPLFATQRAILLLALTSVIHAHTWVEELRLVASNGSYVGAPGYPRNYKSSGDDPSHTYLIPPNGRSTGNAILSTDLMCKTPQSGQISGFPALTAAPQDQIALRYLENGHVSLFTTQRGKPAGRGTVYIYGTDSAAAMDTYLGIHKVWNAAGTGGDKRGKLLATRPFDDGRCFQANGKPPPITQQRIAKLSYPANTELPCQSDVQLPEDAGTSGTYTLYWVWEWPTLYNNGAIQLNESYTSCMDINMVSKSSVHAAGSFNENISGLGVNSMAIEAQLSTAIMINPLANEQTTSDDLNTASTPPGVTAPPEAAADVPASTTSQPASSSLATSTVSVPTPTSSEPAKFFTVTVFATETVTAEPSPTASSATTTPLSLTTTTTSVLAPSSSSPSSSIITTSSSVYLSQPTVGPSSSSLSSSSAVMYTASAPIPLPFLNSVGTVLTSSISAVPTLSGAVFHEPTASITASLSATESGVVSPTPSAMASGSACALAPSARRVRRRRVRN